MVIHQNHNKQRGIPT